MTRRMFLGAIALITLLAVMVVGGMLYVRPATAQNAVAALEGRQITVVGRGEAEGRPDTATVQIGVETGAATAQEALVQNSTQAQAVQAKLAELGVAEQDIQTNNFSIAPAYDQDGRQVTGYRISNTVTVTIRDLDQAGTLLDQVVQLGANRIYGISFSVSDPAALEEQARAEAVEDARTRVAQLAQGAGATVGEVLVITENIGSQPPMPLATFALE
jgi:uncharacterized protein YggE